MMVPAILSYLQTFWPYSLRKLDDLEVSDRIVRGLSIPEQTKQFVFAISEPESQSVVYILATQNLSDQAAFDAECLIKEVRPEAVVAQVTPSVVIEILTEESRSKDNLVKPMPTTSLGVLKGCIIGKINKEMYESVAASLVLREIFGVSFHWHYLVTKKAAVDVGSLFFFLELPPMNAESDSCCELSGNKFQALFLQHGLAPKNTDSVSEKSFCVFSDRQSEMVSSVSSCIAQLDLKVAPVSELETGEIQPRCNYQAPQFSQPIYPLLADLYSIFIDIPSIGKALACAQKMLFDVERGEAVDAQLLYEVQTFRIAVEGLRIALNKAARSPISKLRGSAHIKFSELPMGEKSHILLAKALRSRTKDFKSIVAIVEASTLVGIRKYWKTPVSWEVEDLAKQLIKRYEDDEERIGSGNVDKKLLKDKPMVAVGAGATAILGASSISKVVPLVKLVTLKIPMSIKVFLTCTQKAAAVALGKTFAPSKVVAHGIATYGAKTTSVLKAAASAEKIRSVAHGLIASAEKTSLSIMRTAFYQIMRRRGVQPIGCMPWTTFGCSGATFAALFMYEENIECAAESLPTAPSIASLGRGIRNLHQASQEVRQANSSKMQENPSCTVAIK